MNSEKKKKSLVFTFHSTNCRKQVSSWPEEGRIDLTSFATLQIYLCNRLYIMWEALRLYRLIQDITNNGVNSFKLYIWRISSTSVHRHMTIASVSASCLPGMCVVMIHITFVSIKWKCHIPMHQMFYSKHLKRLNKSNSKFILRIFNSCLRHSHVLEKMIEALMKPIWPEYICWFEFTWEV